MHLRELAALDSAAGGHRVPGGPAGGRAALPLGAAEAGGWNPYQGMVYCWNIFVDDDTDIPLGNITAFSSLHST